MEQFKKISSVNTALIIINIILFLIPDFFGSLISGDVLLEKGTVIPLLVTEGGEFTDCLLPFSFISISGICSTICWFYSY